MATTSYPRVGKNGWNEQEWSKLFDSGDGIVDNINGTSCALTRIDATNTARIAPGRIQVQGYALEIIADEDLPVPTAAGTYDICAMYDPALNVALTGGDANPAGPCRLVCVTSPPSTAGGKVYTLLYRITRATGQALNSATLTRFAQHVGPTMRMSKFPDAAKTQPETAIVGFEHPVGTVVWEQSTGIVWRKGILADAAGNTTGTFWQRDSDVRDFPFASGLRSHDPAPSKPMLIREGDLVKLAGSLEKANGTALSTAGTDVLLGVLPVGFRPPFVQRMIVKVGPGDTFAQLYAQASTGNVYVNGGTGSFDYVDLAGATFYAPAD